MKEYLRKAKIEDAHFIYEIDKLSRKYSINKNIIDYNVYLQWYINRLKDINIYVIY